MILSEAEARKIINLNPYNSIDDQIAERQFQVILKGFNYLIQEESEMLYIADEVGLGKTYVALGIASLLRHFASSKRQAIYKDVVLVPKRNLQYKWVKEINNFVNHNYLLECNIVKSVLGSSVGICNDKSVHHQLDSFDNSGPSYEVFRNSSFSISTSDNFDWKSKLEYVLPDDLKTIFKDGVEKFKLAHQEIYLKRLFAFLLNISFPKVDLLIVDEAHHFKHGIGNGVSYRNQVVSRLMGVIQEEDEVIFNQFPGLKSRITQKAKKVIFLSATPIDNGLHELKQQLDCFLPNHQFKKSENNSDEVKEKLNTFMIRGLMKIKLDQDGDVSRNMYRHEHRRGNVEKTEDAKPQYIEDDLESIIIGLLQLKTLKHFNESNNKSFEIGMLAGFETFKTQNTEEKEFEDATDNSKKAEDHNIIKDISDSYFEEFSSHLPHPKQDNLIRVLFEGIKKGDKSLVFVRRIASVVELERKLTIEVENWHYAKIEKFLNNTARLKQLKIAFEERHQISEIENVLSHLSAKIYEYYKSDYDVLIINEGINVSQLINDYIIAIYNSEEDSSELFSFREQVKKHIKLRVIKSELRQLSKVLLDSHIKLKSTNSDEDDLELEEVEDSFGYFFSSYFSSKRYQEGFNFRKRVATKDWYQFNVYHLKDLLINLEFDASKLSAVEFTDKERTEAKRMYVINEVLLGAKIKENRLNTYDSVDSHFKKKTFFNHLVEGPLKPEFNSWALSKWNTPSKGFDFWEDLNALNEIIQGVFRNGSGLLPAYIAECLDKDKFEVKLIEILEKEFPEVITELKQVLIDFDKIIATNFSNRDRIKRALYGQHPIAGVSGSHKRDVSRVATQFRMPGFPYVLITTDILKEGEDLHLYCKDVYHYGIAWNPSDMEQRTGRIDRINSSCYFQLKKEGERNFDNALQVFYPYLADTLEVNQVAKVFNKMNNFVETFYDISVIRERDTKASIDEIVKEIPVQIKELLSSKYDVEAFEGIAERNKSDIKVINNVGHKKEDLTLILNSTLVAVKNNFIHFENQLPIIDNERFTISAKVDLDGRRAPLQISLIKGDDFDSILYSIESIICRNSELRSRHLRDEIRNFLAEKSLVLLESKDHLLVQKTIEIKSSLDNQIREIKNVIQVADNLEEKYIGIDGDDFF